MITKSNRREFLCRATSVPAAMAAASSIGLGVLGVAATAAAQTPIQRVGGSRLKTSLNAYSFSKALNDALKTPGQGMTLFNLLDFCAEQNFDGIDPTGYFFPGYPAVPAEKYINDFKRRAFELGIDISGTGVRNDFATADKDKRAADVELVKQWIEAAARLGAPVIRVFAGAMPPGQEFDTVAAWMVDSLGPCIDHGKQYGVIVGVQNHNDSLKTADQVLNIVKMVNSDWFGVILDTGMFQTVADPYEEIKKVAPFAVNWQVKEMIDGKDGKGKTDLVKLFRIVSESGYRGYLPIETLYATGEDYDPKQRVAQFLREVRAALQATA